MTPRLKHNMPEYTVNAATVHLQQFLPNHFLAWLRRAEPHLKLTETTSNVTKADYALEAMPESASQDISLWLDTQEEGITYVVSKTRLLIGFSSPASVRTSRQLDLPNRHICNRTPTQLWHKIVTLRQLPEIDETTKQPKQLDLYKDMRLQCFTPDVRRTTPDTNGVNVELIERAYLLSMPHRAASHLAFKQQHVDVAATTTTINHSSDISVRYVTDSICGYHRRFGNLACRCVDKYKHFTLKNATGGCPIITS